MQACRVTCYRARYPLECRKYGSNAHDQSAVCLPWKHLPQPHRGWHVDTPADSRARAEAKRRGICLEDLRSRQVNQADFERFDYVVAMDESNLADLREICPAPLSGRIHLFTDFAPEGTPAGVPDPYYGGTDGFAKVFDLITQCSEGLLARIIEERHKDGAR